MRGEAVAGDMVESISTSTETTTSIPTSTEASTPTGYRKENEAGASGSTTRSTVRAYPIGTRLALRSSTEELPEMRSPGRPSVDAPRQEGRILLVEAQTTLRAAQGAGGRTPRLGGTQVH